MAGMIRAGNGSRFLLLGFLTVIVVVLSLVSEFFLSWENLRNILNQSSLFIMLAVGMSFVIASGGIDLSVGNLAALSGVVMAVLMKAGLGVPAAVAAGFFVAILAGLANGALISLLGINPFITTLATMSLTRGVALILTGGVSIYGFPASFKFWGSGSVWGVNPAILIAWILAAMGMVLMGRTVWGKYSLALGGNAEALRRSGANVSAYRISIYCFSAFCAACAGLVMTARLNSAAPLAGAGYEMDAIAAVVLGGASMKGGRASVFGTFVACIVMGVIRNGLTMLAVPVYYQQIFTGLVILSAVILSEFRGSQGEAVL